MAAQDFIEWAVGISMGLIALGVVYEMWRQRLIERRKQGNWSKQKKRSATVEINGRPIKARKIIERLANKMPAMRHQDTGIRINHKREMWAMYMRHGSKGINIYVDQITGKAAEQLQNQYGK